MSEAGTSESASGEVRPSTGPGESEEGETAVTEGDVATTGGEDSEAENEDATEVTTEGEEGMPGEGPPPESPFPTEDAGIAQFEGREEYGERSEMSELASEEDEEGFSEYEQSSDYFEEDEEDTQATDLAPLFSDDVIQVVSKQIEQPEAPASKAAVDSSVLPRERTPEKEVKRSYSINEADEELTRIPVPTIKANRVIPKQPEPKYQPWPVRVFESENMYKIMEKAVPRFFPRNFPYSVKGVTKRSNLLAQYLQRKLFQMGHDRRKLITVVRFQQKNWNGHRAVIRWLWCMETDALVKYSHEGEGFVSLPEASTFIEGVQTETVRGKELAVNLRELVEFVYNYKELNAVIILV